MDTDNTSHKESSNKGVESTDTPQDEAKYFPGPVIPCTVCQLLSANQINPNEDVFMLKSGISLKQVSLVGQIVDLKLEMTVLNYTIDDGTSSIDVQVIFDKKNEEDLVESRQSWIHGVYVRVVGQLRSGKQGRCIVTHRLILLDDFNELVHHQLEVIELHLLVSKSSKTANSRVTATTTTTTNTTSTTRIASTTHRTDQKPIAKDKSGSQHSDHLTPLQRQVSRFMVRLVLGFKLSSTEPEVGTAS
eukprot:TRINITY_DN1529_c0_g2_i4.p1 TRINITY_DN1529_c0_g2~~TRINITY_DN1529_c0_g2_i4.p1  ORF type:complete len:246 (+),score=24.62 TRINITY_DN1529_c0_g2_i4:91-828(+)